jgi:hypothetical protein
MTTLPSESRRYDVDWVRIFALKLLILYHVVISFQPWAAELIYFVENEKPLTWLWIPMEIINIWRIPLLFFISGMGLRFAMKSRSTGKLLADRSWRILFPAVIGFFLICPLSILLFQNYYKLDPKWIPNPGHLWFLFNIFAYVLLLIPFIALLKKFPNNPLTGFCRKLTSHPVALLFLLVLPYALEGYFLQPEYYSLFVFTLHGFVIGFLSFLAGFLMACLGERFWSLVQSLRFTTLAIALSLYAVRLFYFKLENTNNTLNGVECSLWIIAILGFAATHLNQDSTLLRRLSPAVYPIYILHLPIQFAIASILFKSTMPAFAKLLLLLLGTFTICWALYECIRRIPPLRPLFGMKYRTT